MIDAFLKLKPKGAVALAGEVTDAGYQRTIELLDFRIGGGISADAVKGVDNATRGKKHGPFGFEIKKAVDATSPYLFKAYCTTFSRRLQPGDNLFDAAEVRFRKAGGAQGAYRSFVGAEFLKFEFTQVVLFGYKLTAQANGEAEETVSFAFRTVKLGYQPQAATGSTQPPREVKGWDYQKNAPV